MRAATLTAPAGEILLWWGIFTTASAVLRGPAPHWTWVCVASPLLTTALLMFVSGIPGLERTYDERFRGTPDYDEYKRRTSVLVPLPPALYGAMPALGKGLCCCEWPMYSAGAHRGARRPRAAAHAARRGCRAGRFESVSAPGAGSVRGVERHSVDTVTKHA